MNLQSQGYRLDLQQMSKIAANPFCSSKRTQMWPIVGRGYAKIDELGYVIWAGLGLSEGKPKPGPVLPV